jgi:hypothetical protein
MARHGHRRRSSGLLRLGVLAVAGVVAVLLLISAIPGFPNLNPFATETKDRSQPVLLKSLVRLSEYRAASANLQVVVDVEQDAKLLPSFIKGEKVLFVAAGSVDAGVDFRRLDKRSVVVSDDRRTATITLPAPRLSKARVDLSRSRVFNRDRGLLDRIGSVFSENPSDERQLYLLAEKKLTEAAAQDASLPKAAARNTRALLDGLLRSLGFTKITVRFAPPAT